MTTITRYRDNRLHVDPCLHMQASLALGKRMKVSFPSPWLPLFTLVRLFSLSLSLCLSVSLSLPLLLLLLLFRCSPSAREN